MAFFYHLQVVIAFIALGGWFIRYGFADSAIVLGDCRMMRMVAYLMSLGGPLVVVLSGAHMLVPGHTLSGDVITFILGTVWFVVGSMDAGELLTYAQAIEDARHDPTHNP